MMRGICIFLILVSVAASRAALCGPYLFWGHPLVENLQPRTLVEASEKDFSELYKEAKAIIVFVRNTSSSRLDGTIYPKFQNLIKNNAWSYLPQHSLAADPFNYNANVEIIKLSGNPEQDDSQLISAYDDFVTNNRKGEVLAILANSEEDSHFIAKRQAKDNEEESRATTTTPSGPEESEENFIYVAKNYKAALYLNYAPVLNISKIEKSLKLNTHLKEISFDDQKVKGYGRLSVPFKVEKEIDESGKINLRFNFTLNRGTWSMTAVEVSFTDRKMLLPIVGNAYSIPSAPVGFSYRCSARDIIFSNNGSDILLLKDYQVQPWLNGAKQFGDVYDCIGFTTGPIWAGILISLFLCGILSIGIIALLDIKPPNRFESSRSKQLTINVQE